MIGRRLIFTTCALTLLFSTHAQAGIFNRKPKPDVQKSKQLAEALRTDPIEARRAAAAAELREHDPKGNMDVLAALIGALQRDASVSVRFGAAAVLGEISPYSAQAGLALERAAEGDRSPQVREAAKEALWEYHLNGYRSQYFAERTTFQTTEPPLARASTIRATGAVVPVVPPRLTLPAPPTAPPAITPPASVPVAILPPLVAPPGLVKTSDAGNSSQRLLFRPNFPLNRTEEPPLAQKRLTP